MSTPVGLSRTKREGCWAEISEYERSDIPKYDPAWYQFWHDEMVGLIAGDESDFRKSAQEITNTQIVQEMSAQNPACFTASNGFNEAD